jgi:Fe-S-cluster containining protein
MPCNGCGDCCNPVTLAPGYRQRILDWDFDWPPNEDDLAVGIWAFELEARGHDEAGNEQWTCRHHDPDVGCTAYEDRPPICSGYPWYDGYVPRTTKLPARCGYWSETSVNVGGLGLGVTA